MGIFNWGSNKDNEVKVGPSQQANSQEVMEVMQESSSQVVQIVKTVAANNVKQKIHKDMTIGESVRLYPDTVPVMLEHGIHCVGCHVAHWETLEQGFRGHYGMDDEKLTAFIQVLNDVADGKIKKEMIE